MMPRLPAEAQALRRRGRRPLRRLQRLALAQDDRAAGRATSSRPSASRSEPADGGGDPHRQPGDRGSVAPACRGPADGAAGVPPRRAADADPAARGVAVQARGRSSPITRTGFGGISRRPLATDRGGRRRGIAVPRRRARRRGDAGQAIRPERARGSGAQHGPTGPRVAAWMREEARRDVVAASSATPRASACGLGGSACAIRAAAGARAATRRRPDVLLAAGRWRRRPCSTTWRPTRWRTSPS